MGKVTVLNMDLVCEDSGHQVVPMGPNTCITPGVVAGAPGPGELSISVSSYCVCPLDLNTQVDCSTICVPSLEPTQFYDLSAQLIFDGVMLPDITLSGEMSVLAQ